MTTSEDYLRFIKEFRRKTGKFSIMEIANQMRVSKTCVYQWFNGVTRMNPESMIRAIYLYGIDMEVLYHAKWGTLQ